MNRNELCWEPPTMIEYLKHGFNQYAVENNMDMNYTPKILIKVGNITYKMFNTFIIH